MTDDLLARAKRNLKQLCEDIGERCVGSRGNQEAAELFARFMKELEFATEMPEFSCFDWSHAGASLEVAGEPFHVFVSPYSLGCSLKAPLCLASSREELETVEAAGKILLLTGELAREQLMPKNFTFYNPEEHQKIIRLLETSGCKAVAAATGRNPEMTGGVYPFPLIEDGDFNLPSIYMTEVTGEKLRPLAGERAALEINAVKIPSRGCNVVARKGDACGGRIVIFAHIDSKQGTAGALDNGSGVVVLMLLGHLLKDYEGSLQVELVALNGEDYYSNPGQVLYLKENRHKFADTLLGINIDGVGCHDGNTAFSLYGCPEFLEKTIREAFSAKKGMVQGEPWFQGDHGLFIMNKRPALAITSERLDKVLEIAHTPGDHMGVVACGKLVETAEALWQLISNLDDRAKLKRG